MTVVSFLASLPEPLYTVALVSAPPVTAALVIVMCDAVTGWCHRRLQARARTDVAERALIRRDGGSWHR